MSEFKADGVTKVLSNRDMKRLGFRNNVEGQWNWCRSLDLTGDVTLNITIKRKTGEYKELVMSEAFGQPEYYGRMKPEWRDFYRDAIDLYLRQLRLGGLDIKVNHKAYGCEG